MTCGAGLCCISKSVGGWTRTSKCLAKYLGAFRQAGSLDPQSQIDLSFVWIWHQGWASGYFHAAQSAKLGGDFLGEIHLILKFSQNFNEGWDDFYEFRMWGEWDSFWTIAEEWACSLGRSDKNKWNKCWRWDRHSKTLWVVRSYTSILFPLPLPRKDFTRLADRLEPGVLLLFADLHYEISLPMAQMARFSKLPWEMATKVEVVIWWKRYASGWRISKPILCCTTRRAAIARIAQIASSDARRIDCPQSFGSTRSWCMCKEESLDVRSSKSPYVMDVWKPGYGYGSCEGILKMNVECKRYTWSKASLIVPECNYAPTCERRV